MRGLCRAAALCALAAAPALLAQDLAPRRGFAVRIVEPRAADVVVGEATIRAEVTTRREEDVARVDFFVDDKLILADPEPPYQAVFNFGKQSAARVVRVVAHHRDGPTASDFVITRAFDLQYVVNVQRVVLDVSVRDSKRRVVTGLSAADFSVLEDGRPQTITSVSPERRPVLVGVLLDSSGSMRDRIAHAQEAACRFVEALTDQDRAFVIEFDDQVTLIEETTPDRALLCRSIRSTRAVGATALFDAVHAAYRVIHELAAERRALVVLSDGEDTSSQITFDDLLTEARLNDVTVYAVGLDVGLASLARSQLSRLAEETGGRSFFVKQAEELADTYALIAEELRTLYQLVYASNNDTRDGRFMRIKVAVAGDKELDVRHRAGYHAVVP